MIDATVGYFNQCEFVNNYKFTSVQGLTIVRFIYKLQSWQLLYFLTRCPNLKLYEKAQNAMLSNKSAKIDLEIVYIRVLAHCIQKFKCIARCVKILKRCLHSGFSPLHDCIFRSIHHLHTQITISSSLQRLEWP